MGATVYRRCLHHNLSLCRMIGKGHRDRETDYYAGYTQQEALNAGRHSVPEARRRVFLYQDALMILQSPECICRIRCHL